MSSVTVGRHRLIVATGGLLVLLFVGWLAWTRLPPPQIGANEDVFNTVDALFTAVTSRDLSRLEDCEHRLKQYQDEGKLPAKPARHLTAVIQQARAGQWEPAAKRLYDFMYHQRGR